MASIRKRNELWQVQVRNRKIGSTSKSFHKKADAIAWAKVQEAMMQTGEWKPKDKSYDKSKFAFKKDYKQKYYKQKYGQTRSTHKPKNKGKFPKRFN